MSSGNSFSDRPAVSAAIVIGLLALLPLLAWLQYRWIGQVSEAERARLEEVLQDSTNRFVEDVNTTITSIAMSLLDRRLDLSFATPDYAQRYAAWRRISPNRRLVSEFYLSAGGQLGLDQLGRVDPNSGKVADTAWPDDLLPLKARIEEVATRGFRPGAPPWAVVVDGLSGALAAPQAGQGPWNPEEPAPTGWALVRLDRQYLTGQWLPDLVRRYFREDYRVEIVWKGDPSRIIFQTDPGSGLARYDMTADLFEARPEMFGGRGGRRFGGGGGRGRGRGPVPPGAPPGGGRWELRVENRAGSLDAVVSQARTRNIVVSLGILLLLGASVSMLVVLTRRAQRLARLQMEFVAGVSHELRTPLTVIRSAGDNLADGVVDDEQRIRRYGAVIRDEGTRLTQMVEQILRFAGIQSGRARYDLQPVAVSAVLEAARATSEGALRKAGCQLEVSLPGELPPILADSTALAHCFSNLLTNAAKYASQGAWVGIEARRDGGVVEVAVKDRGPGIDKEDLAHVFEPFYRGRKAIADQVQGAGMGLSLVKRIVQAHNGTVEVSSRPGEGAMFLVRLPIAS